MGAGQKVGVVWAPPYLGRSPESRQRQRGLGQIPDVPHVDKGVRGGRGQGRAQLRVPVDVGHISM